MRWSSRGPTHRCCRCRRCCSLNDNLALSLHTRRGLPIGRSSAIGLGKVHRVRPCRSSAPSCRAWFGVSGHSLLRHSSVAVAGCSCSWLMTTIATTPATISRTPALIHTQGLYSWLQLTPPGKWEQTKPGPRRFKRATYSNGMLAPAMRPGSPRAEDGRRASHRVHPTATGPTTIPIDKMVRSARA